VDVPGEERRRFRPGRDGRGPGAVVIDTVIMWVPTAEEPDEPEPPVDPVTPPTNDARLFVWREGSPASNLGCRNAVSVAVRGKTDGDDIRLISMNGDPTVAVDALVRRTKKAKEEGCIGVCIDLESYVIRTGAAHCAKIAAAIRPILPLWWAPKVYLDHMVKHWGGDFKSNARWLQKHGDGLIPWIYSKADAGPWIELHKAFKNAGYTKPFVCLGDFRWRTSAGERTAAFTPQAIREFKAAGESVGAFAPDTNNFAGLVKATETWRTAVQQYG
jgi:hypothetical protein